MLFGIRFRDKSTGNIIGYFIDPVSGDFIGAKSKINARRLADRVRKTLRKRGMGNLGVETFRLR